MPGAQDFLVDPLIMSLEGSVISRGMKFFLLMCLISSSQLILPTSSAGSSMVVSEG